MKRLHYILILNALKDIVYTQCNIILQETGAALFTYYLILNIMLYNNNYIINS